MQETFPVQTTTPNLSRCTQATGFSTANPLYHCLFDINRRANGSGGHNFGAEFQLRRKLFGPFGVVLDYTYSDAKSDAGDPIPEIPSICSRRSPLRRARRGRPCCRRPPRSTRPGRVSRSGQPRRWSPTMRASATRGLMLDSARHMQSPAYIRRLLDWMIASKLNRLHRHLVDDQGWRLPVPKYPRLTGVSARRRPATAAGAPPLSVTSGFWTR